MDNNNNINWIGATYIKYLSYLPINKAIIFLIKFVKKLMKSIIEKILLIILTQNNEILECANVGLYTSIASDKWA